MGGSINGDTQKLIVYKGKSQSTMDDDWGYPHLWKAPYDYICIYSHHVPIIFRSYSQAQLLRRPTSVPSSRVSFARARPWPFPSAGHSASGHRFGARKLLRVIFCHIYLVGGFNHLEQYESQWLVDYPIYYGNFKKMKPPTSVPIIILCLVYAYHPIMVHHIKSLGGGWGF